jgi:hypothetical protein
MDPRVNAKKYGRTGVVIGNGYINTDWDEAAAASNDPTADKRPYHAVGPKTDFSKAPQEDRIAFTIIRYANGTPYKAVPYAVQGRTGDNSPNMPINFIVNGLAGDDQDEVADQIQVVGLHLGEGSVQMGGSGRTQNVGKYSFPPGTLIGTRVPAQGKWGNSKEEEIDRDNVALEPFPLNPNTIRTTLLDRGRMLRALRELSAANPRRPGALLVLQGNPAIAYSQDAKEILHVLLNQVYQDRVTVILGLDIPGKNAAFEGRQLLEKAIAASFNVPPLNPGNGEYTACKEALDERVDLLHKAYEAERGRESSLTGRLIIEPMEALVMAAIDRKNNSLRKVLGVSVAPIHESNPMLALNLIPYSR